MSLDRGTDQDREILAAARAEEWRGRLTAEQFFGRNRRLYSHPFGRARVQTWIWRRNQDILSSLDALSVQLWAGNQVRDAWLIASVVTPETHRGHGYATELLKALFATDPQRAALLYSDIDPAFYERLGFRVTPHEETEVLCFQGVGGPLKPIPPSRFLDYQRWARREEARRAGPQAAWLEPDAEFLDWHLERYRYFSTLKGKPWDGQAYFETDHAHVLALAPDPIHDRLDALWLGEECERCVQAGTARAAELGLGRLRYWRPWRAESLGARENPMVRIPGMDAAVPGPGVQLGDWW